LYSSLGRKLITLAEILVGTNVKMLLSSGWLTIRRVIVENTRLIGGGIEFKSLMTFGRAGLREVD